MNCKRLKKLLILNGSFCEKPLIIKAKEKGYYVATTGNAPELLGHAYADEYIPADYSDKEAILNIVRAHGFDGVISCANDFGILTAAYVSEKMGWKGYDTYETTLLLHHKDRFKEYCRTHRIPSVQSRVFTEKEELLSCVKTCDYPIIIKANDLTGGKGIRRADSYAEAERVAEYAFAASRDKHILVEPFLVGTQHAVDVFLADGKIIATTSCNCYSDANPYLIQTETYPSDYEKEDTPPICEIVLKMTRDLHLADGPLTVQYIRSGGHIFVIEVMRRLTGNLSFSLYERATGFPWYEGYLRACLGKDCADLTARGDDGGFSYCEAQTCQHLGNPVAWEDADVVQGDAQAYGFAAYDRTGQFCGHHGIFAEKNGVFKGYHVPEEIRAHVYETVNLIAPGETIHNHETERIASLFYTYDTKEEMDIAARLFHKRITVDIEKQNK